MKLKYPLPADRRTPGVSPQISANHFTPRLLCNTEDHVLIWLPPLAKQGQGNKQPPILRILWAVTHLRIPSFWYLTLRFFHIFTPQESCCILGAKDAENYLYKPFIDALALSLRITDSPFTFSYSAYNLASKNTNPGCYIKITKRAEKVGFLPNLRISFLRSNKCKPLKNTEISVSENTEITFQKSPQ